MLTALVIILGVYFLIGLICAVVTYVHDYGLEIANYDAEEILTYGPAWILCWPYHLYRELFGYNRW